MSCTGSGIMLFYKWKKSQPKNKEDTWYFEMYERYYSKEVKKCRDKQRKMKRE